VSFKNYLAVAVLLFGMGIVLGIYSPPGSGMVEEEMSVLEDMLRRLAGLPPVLLAIAILFKNVFALLFSFAFAPLLSLLPVLTLVVNGWILGVIAAKTVEEVSLGYLLAGILPHGIIEIPALMIGEAAALSFGVSIFYSLFRKNEPGYLTASFKKSFRYLILAVALMVPAALIETFITPLLLGLFR
jgi:stage II sporulation protein M